MINLKVIKDLKPCQERLDNYIKFYSEKTCSIRQFMGLKNITHNDKLWVAFRLLPKDKIRFAAADIASLVLHIYEDRFPNDLRPRQAIEAARNNSVTPEVRKAAYAAYAANAAYAAAAAANAAYAADAAYAAAAYADAAANAAAAAAAAVGKGREAMEKKIRTILIRYLK